MSSTLLVNRNCNTISVHISYRPLYVCFNSEIQNSNFVQRIRFVAASLHWLCDSVLLRFLFNFHTFVCKRRNSYLNTQYYTIYETNIPKCQNEFVVCVSIWFKCQIDEAFSTHRQLPTQICVIADMRWRHLCSIFCTICSSDSLYSLNELFFIGITFIGRWAADIFASNRKWKKEEMRLYSNAQLISLFAIQHSVFSNN